MAQLVDTAGLKFSFDPSAILAVSDHDDATNTAVTCVYGITAAALAIPETVSGFLGRLDLTAKFAKLTRPNSTFVWVCGSAVTSIRANLPGEYPGAQSVLSVGTLTQAVCEDMDAVTAAIDAHGGKL